MSMDLNVLKEILNSELDSALPIVSWSCGQAHLTNTWVSYARLKEDKYLLIPVAGMSHLEEDLKANKRVLCSLTNRDILGNLEDGAGHKLPGTGVVCKGNAEIVTQGDFNAEMNAAYPWSRATLIITLDDIKQTL